MLKCTIFAMTTAAVLARLEALSDPKLKEQNAKRGVSENQFGVKMGDIRGLAKEIKLNPELAKELWATGNYEAMLLAILLMKPKQLSEDEVEGMVRTVKDAWVADWLSSYVIKQHPRKEALREKWMTESHEMAARFGWSLTAERIAKSPAGIDLDAILTRIEAEMLTAPELVKWTMNYALAETGINHPEYRERAIAIGEKLGVYRDYPTSKGCTSPFAPIWINEMVSRQS